MSITARLGGQTLRQASETSLNRSQKSRLLLQSQALNPCSLQAGGLKVSLLPHLAPGCKQHPETPTRSLGFTSSPYSLLATLPWLIWIYNPESGREMDLIKRIILTARKQERAVQPVVPGHLIHQAFAILPLGLGWVSCDLLKTMRIPSSSKKKKKLKEQASYRVCQEVGGKNSRDSHYTFTFWVSGWGAASWQLSIQGISKLLKPKQTLGFI